MITISTLAKHHSALLNASYANRAKIEKFYNKNDKKLIDVAIKHGYPETDTTIPPGYLKRDDILQRNSYVLAYTYCYHSYHLFMVPKASLDLFNKRLIGITECDKMSTEDLEKNPATAVPDEFIADIENFRILLKTFEQSIEDYKRDLSPENAKEQLSEYFASFVDKFFQAELSRSKVVRAANQAIEILAKQSTPDDISMDWESLLKLGGNFDGVLISPSVTYRPNKETGKLERVPEDPERSVRCLTNYFVQHLKTKENIKLFVDAVSPLLTLQDFASLGLDDKDPESGAKDYWAKSSLWKDGKETKAETSVNAPQPR